MTGPDQRRQYLSTAREMVLNFTAEAKGWEEEEKVALAELWDKRARTVQWLLDRTQQSGVNVLTGELTVALHEPEEVA